MISEMDIKANLRKIAIDELKGYLTCGRAENSQNPFTNDEMSLFVTKNTQKIDDCVNEIYNAYSKDDTLDELVNPENEWIREYVFRKKYFGTLTNKNNNKTNDDDSDNDSDDE